MATRVETVSYFKVMIPHRAGAGARVLAALRQGRVALRAVHAFPAGRGAQIDLVPVDAGKLRRAAAKARIRLGRPKKALLVEGPDRTGVLAAMLAPVAEAGISVTAATAVRAGRGRFGAILWVAQRDVARTRRALASAG
jgi:hypothetical protein